MVLFFLIAVVAGLPWLSAQSFRNLKLAEKEMGDIVIPKNALYAQTIIMQLLLFGIAWMAMRSESFNVNWIGKINAISILAAIAFIAFGLVISYFSQKSKKATEEKHALQYLLPNNAKERIYWVVACMFAALCEEFVYRGVLFQILMGFTNYWILAAALCAIVFAFGHGTQGESAIITIIPFALGFQFIVWLSGGLLLAIITHFAYNVLVDLIYGKQIKTTSKNRDHFS